MFFGEENCYQVFNFRQSIYCVTVQYTFMFLISECKSMQREAKHLLHCISPVSFYCYSQEEM